MSTMESQRACLFCGSIISSATVAAPEWHSADRRPILQFRCEDKCGTMLLDTVKGSVELDPKMISLLNDASPEELEFLSTTNRTWIDGVVYGSWLIEELLYVYQIAAIAVSRFGFINAKILSTAGGVDHGNTLLFINASKGRFTLRVYAPDTEESHVLSEIYWLNSLNRDTNVSVPLPLCGLDGSEVHKISLEPGFRYCTAFNWIEGVRLEAIASSARSPEVIGSIGKNLAAMHNYAATCTLPTWFNRPEYGLARFRQNLGPDPREKVRNILRRIEKLGESRNVFGLIHHETGSNNILINDNSSAFIDFRSFGWGYYFLDIVQVLRDLQPEESRFFLAAYQQERELAPNSSEMIEYFNEIM